MVYFPKTTMVDDQSGTGPQCSANASVGYHSYGTDAANVDYSYAVIPDCTGMLADVTSTASHELIESATDPYDAPKAGWFMDAPTPSLWYAAYPEEVGDLCEYEANTTEGMWTVQRIWSMTAAAAGGSPCVPVPAGEVYFSTTSSPNQMQTVPAGGSATFTMTGWSTSPGQTWQLFVDAADQTDFDPTATISSSSMTTGGTVTVTLHAPAGTPSGKVGAAFISSGDATGDLGRFWPVGIIVQ
jgi:hypothetical protein